VTSPELVRYCLTVHYDGFPFHGWQLQPESRTVQGEIEAVLERITGARRPVVGSGRTDRGVHATGQIASVDVPTKWSARTLRTSMNALLPREIWIAEARRVRSDFHPRFAATARSYSYRLGLRYEAGSPFFRRWCWDASREPPDPELLAASARLIPGERSFRGFSKAGQPERGERCHVHAADWIPWKGPGLELRITADRFLHHMVRYLVGTMVDVARGRRPLEEMGTLLSGNETDLTTSPPAPPEGLFLTRVDYPPERLGEHPDRDPPPKDDVQP